MATKVILDTDIGGDIDDTWALVMMLKCPELDVKMVCSDSGNTEYRAKLIAKFLELAGRTDVEVGIGTKFKDGVGLQGPWVADYDLAQYPGKVHQDGVQAMIDMIMNSQEQITLICIGPVPNIEEALKREPRIAEKAKFVGMYGRVRYKEGLKAEWNVRANPQAAQAALSALWDTTITPLNTCGKVRLKDEKYQKVLQCQDPVVKAMIENYKMWAEKKENYDANTHSSTLFDTVAVYLAFSNDLLVMEDLGITVSDEGQTDIDENGKVLHVATEWKDLGAFEDFLIDRLYAPVVMPVS